MGDLFDYIWRKIKTNTRPLTPVEEEARLVFWDLINYDQVRIDENSMLAKIGAWAQGARGLGVCTFHTINFNRPIYAQPGNSDMCWLIHELTHVAQYELVGFRYLGEAIAAQAREGYNYGGPEALEGRAFKDFNREQQGDIVQDYYKLLHCGEDTSLYDPLIDDLRAGRL